MTDFGELQKFLDVRVTREHDEEIRPRTLYQYKHPHLVNGKIQRSSLPVNAIELLTTKENYSKTEMDYIQEFPYREIIGSW